MRRQMYPIDQRVELRDETLEPVKEEKRFKRGVSDEFAGEVRNSCMQLCPADGKKYCSTFCAEATPVTEVICQCKHIECENLRH